MYNGQEVGFNKLTKERNMSKTWLFICLAICVLAVLYVIFNYVKIKKLPEGNERMVKMSAIIREGAGVFLKKEFTTIGIVVLVIAILFSLFITTIVNVWETA